MLFAFLSLMKPLFSLSCELFSFRLRDQENRGICPGADDELNQFLVQNDAEMTPFVFAQLNDTLSHFIQPLGLPCVLLHIAYFDLSFC